MRTLFFDIETLPAPPDREDIVRDMYEKVADRRMSFEEYHRQTSLNANVGQILCIGYGLDAEPAQVLTGDEKEQLLAFWQQATSVDRFVGHHILGFDLPFLYKRSIIHGVQPSHDYTMLRDTPGRIFDTKKEWDMGGSGPATSLDVLARILGLPSSKQGIDGSQVYDFWRAGRLQEIYDYCARDVEVTRKIYQRVTFS